MAKLKITQTKSTIGSNKRHKRTMEALGLRRMSQSNVLDETPELRGMLSKVSHLVSIEKVKE